MVASMPLVLMMAGGTGGHVYPALAVARELLDRGYRVEWVGTARGLEQRVVPAAGIRLHHLVVRGVRGKNLLNKLIGPWPRMLLRSGETPRMPFQVQFQCDFTPA